MNRLPRSTLVFLSATTLATVATAAPIERVANTTLRLPGELPSGSFKLVNAFEGITFRRPVGIVTPPGENNRLFVLEQPGVIRVIPDLANPSKETFLDLSDVTISQGESGVLGLAFHPNYAENRTFFVYYSIRQANRTVQRVARFLTDPTSPNRALRDSEVPLIDQQDRANNHNGGDLHFGPDGYLYISLGDGGGANDRFDNSRFIDRGFHSAIARIDVDRRPESLEPNPHESVHPGTYAIPPDNPFIGVTQFMGREVDPDEVRTEFWAVGLRNPWRMTFDVPTGRLFCGDVGQDAREEINLIERGRHYGWSFREGTRKFTSGPGRSNEPENLDPVEPLWDYRRSDGISVTGGVVYRGEEHTELYEAYVFGDFGSGVIWALHLGDDDTVEVKKIAQEESNEVSAFAIDPRNGDVLYAAHGRGQIKRIARKSRGFALLIPSKLSRTGVFADLETLTPEDGIVAYHPNIDFWSDGAIKRRWFSVPEMDAVIEMDPVEPWTFPEGTTWIKHFDLELEPGNAASRRRVETRILRKTETGSYGLSYAWNEEQTDATVVDAAGDEATFLVQQPDGSTMTQKWSFPSRNACRACHTREAGHALSFRTTQLNREVDYPSETANQLHALAQAGYFADPLPGDPANMPRLPSLEDASASLESRARAYLDVNCSQCHRHGGPALGFWDAQAHLSLADSGIIDGPLINNLADETYRVIAPGNPGRSMILSRIAGIDGLQKMPLFGGNVADAAAIELLQRWVQSLTDGEVSPTPYETWIANYSDTLGTAVGREDDPDKDGLRNEEEFVADSDPTRPDRGWYPAVVVEAEELILALPPLPNGTVEYQTSDDAQSWRSWTPDAADVLLTANGSRRISLERSDTRRFYRFRLVASEG